MGEAGPDRSELMKEVWPDKVLFAATILLVTALLGIVHGLAFAALDITLSEKVPWLLRAWPPQAVLALSIAEAAGALIAIHRQQTEWTLAAGVAGVVSFSVFGLGSILALVALVFVGLAKLEGEDAPSPEAQVEAETWPDKALAASTVLTVTGVLTLGWGMGHISESFVFEGYMPQVAFGWLCIGLGALSLVAAYLLYRQQGAWMGVLAGLGSIASLALYVVGPLLGIAVLYLVWQAKREDEFSGEPGGGQGVAGAG